MTRPPPELLLISLCPTYASPVATETPMPVLSLTVPLTIRGGESVNPPVKVMPFPALNSDSTWSRT
jgi:hypothetical protein